MTRSRLLLLVALLTVAGCADSGLLPGGWLGRRQAPAGALGGSEQRRDPALSGDGRLLASISERQGRSTVMLQEQASGRLLPLRHLRGHGPHRSPSLSWNGRYLAVLMQQGMQTVAVVEDRLQGQLLRLPAPAGASLERLSLAPDGQTLALQLVQAGQQRVQVFDLSGLLEPDRAGGRRISDPGP
ncbi:MAG: hypothetical protein RLZZ336_976 [Cyanobacteriota bacterium]